MKKATFSTVLAAAALMTTAPAFGFSLGGYTGPITLKYGNFEYFSAAQNGSLPQCGSTIGSPVDGEDCSTFQDGNEDLVGVLRISSIHEGLSSFGPTLWSDGTAGEEFVGIFYGFDNHFAVPDGTGGINFGFTGGYMDLYLQPVGTLDVSPGSGGVADLGDDNGDGLTESYASLLGSTPGTDGGETPFVTLEFTPGINALGSTLAGSLDGLTFPVTGTSDSYADVATNPQGVTGSGNGTFDQDVDWAALFGSGPIADVFLKSDLIPNFAASGVHPDFQLLSDDPVRTFVPEPGMVALLGAGLAGLGAVSRRRRKQA